MTRTATKAVPEQATFDTTFDTVGAWKSPALDQATIDFYLRRGRRERARAFAEMIRAVFSSPASRRSAELHALPARRRETAAPGCAECTDRAA